MAEPLTELERAVMEALLAGADPHLAVLRDQLSAATVAAREFTGRVEFVLTTLNQSIPD